jgi:hypothetical protein
MVAAVGICGENMQTQILAQDPLAFVAYSAAVGAATGAVVGGLQGFSFAFVNPITQGAVYSGVAAGAAAYDVADAARALIQDPNICTAAMFLMAANDAGKTALESVGVFIQAQRRTRPGTGDNPNDPNRPPTRRPPDDPPPPDSGDPSQNDPNNNEPGGGHPGNNNNDGSEPGRDGSDGDNTTDGDDTTNDDGSEGGGSCNSFSADTIVVTEDGEIPIARIELGDYVLAYNEWTGELGYYPVIATISHIDESIVRLVIDDEVIQTTTEHPFYTVASEWVDASDLEAGDQVVNLAGQIGEVESIEIIPAVQWMYNLTVDEAHTFFVGEGEWLVHNAKACPIPRKQGYNESGRTIERVRERRFEDAQGGAVYGNRAAAWTNKGRFVDGTYYNGRHAEVEIVSKLDPGELIVELYSELQPCSNCQASLAPHMADNAAVSYSFDYQSRAARNVDGSHYQAEYWRYIQETRDYLISRGLNPASIEYENRLLNGD